MDELDRVAGRAGEGDSVRPSLARLLDEEGYASRDQVEDALREGSQTGERLGEVLLRRAIVDERQLARLLARQWNLPYLDEHELSVDPEALSLLPADEAQRLATVPVGWQEGRLKLVIAEPSKERLHALNQRLGDETEIAVVSGGTLARLLEQTQTPPATAGAATGIGGSDQPAVTSELLPTLAALVGELDEGTARVLAVRGKLEQLAGQLVEQQQALARHEVELADAQRTLEHDQNRISRLERELAETRHSREDADRANDDLRRQLAAQQQLLSSFRRQLLELAETLSHTE